MPSPQDSGLAVGHHLYRALLLLSDCFRIGCRKQQLNAIGFIYDRSDGVWEEELLVAFAILKPSHVRTLNFQELFSRRALVACSHLSGLSVRSNVTAGLNGFRGSRSD